MTITGAEAYEAVRAHHRVLGEQLAGRADAVSGAVAAGQPYGAAVAGLIAYLAEEVLPHAAAEEKTIYPAAAANADLAGLVGEMIAEHVTLSAAAARLAALNDGGAVAGQARQIAGLFTAHAARENDILLPALLADQSVDLAALLDQMHDEAGSTGTPVPAAQSQAADPQAEAEAAAAPGSADPDLDVRDMATARRHETIFAAYRALLPGTGFVLVNDHDPKPLRYQFEAEHAAQFTWDYLEAGPDAWRVRIGRPPVAAGAGAGQDGESAGEEPDLDVRRVAHAQRHGVIFAEYRALRPGRGFVLVNDHDPLRLRYQFEAQYPGEFTWDYQQAGPKLWRVRIGRARA